MVVSDILFFDNLGLFYIVRETPPNVLARVFVRADARMSGALLGLMTPEQRQAIHFLMAKENDDNEKAFEEANDAILMIAEELIGRGLVRKDGLYYFGIPTDLKAEEAAPKSK